MKKILKNESVENLTFEGDSIFHAEEWNAEIYSDLTPDDSVINITVTMEDLQNHYSDLAPIDLPFNYFFENCERNEFVWYVESVALAIAREYDECGNLEYEVVKKQPCRLAQMLRNLFNQ